MCVCVLPLCLTFHSICQPRPLYSYILRPPQLPGVLYAFHFTLPVSKHFIPFFSSFPRFSTYTYIHMYFFFRLSCAQYFSRVFPIFRSCDFLLCLFALLTDNGRREWRRMGWYSMVWYGMVCGYSHYQLSSGFIRKKHEQNLVLVSQFLTVV